MERDVVITILGTAKHCDNSCRGMSHDAKQCLLFNADLVWDKRKKSNGNKRLEACKGAEVQR